MDITNLELSVALVEQHINSVQLANIAVLLEFLTDLGTDSGYGHVQRVHGLDLGGLYRIPMLVVVLIQHHADHIFGHDWPCENIAGLDISGYTDSAQPLPVGLEDSELRIVPVNG